MTQTGTDDRVSSQRIASALREQILSGQVTPGTWLRQDEIAMRLGTSRLPVREALRILELEGLAETLPNRGSRVPSLDLEEVNTYYRMRERLEPLTLAESLAWITDDQVDLMEEIQERIEAAEGGVDGFLALDRDFHMASYAACPSEPLLATTVRLWNATQHYRRAFMQLAGTHRLEIVNAEHRLILDAVRRRDPEDAERFITGHIRRTRVELTSHPELFTNN
ncbi:Transcriptional regulator, GntR family [metagenome]|uniref:Transcriptional regulator, GntR family n=1 Tax=metagenome TaxID=256318 RepID=A0A2P2C0H6_9ZZZZ